MMLSIDNLKKMGAFTGAPVEREIEWAKDGKKLTATVFVLPLSYMSAKADMTAINPKTDLLAARIAASICDEAGEPVFTPGDITGQADPERGPLDGALTMALLAVIGEVNGLGKQQS